MVSSCFLKRYSMSCQLYAFLSVWPILLQGNHCIVPQASQEDSLRSFKSYSDVTMFHYTVPREVPRATWQFAAFMDDPSCQPRKVYIHLRFGSYPIISTNDETFPGNVSTSYQDVQRDRGVMITTTTAYQPKNATILPIYGPLAGDWFVGAYMSRWDERVQQQGLGHKCQYSIGTVALWSQVDSIENIPIGYQTKLRTSATTTHYKLYIPSGTWSFNLSIWNCSFTLRTPHDLHQLCIKSMFLKGRALPVLDYSRLEGSISLAVQASYTFIESSPYEDSYYYLSIVSSSIIEFNVKVDLSECQVRVIEKSFAKKYINTALSFNSVTESNAKESVRHELQYYERNDINRVSYEEHDFYKNKFYQKNVKHDTEDTCMPRHQLVRVNYAESFSGTYFLQGIEWLSSRLTLIDSVPVMTQFDVLPLINIGSTLDISVHLDTEKLSPNVLVLITMCIQRGRIPKLEKHSCRNDALSMNLSSLDKHNATLLIAYPQPDTWYIITRATCYDYSKLMHCQFNDISVLLNVHTKKCVFSDPSPCGDHGVCREIQKNGLHYATCVCFEGYSGWDCANLSSAYAAVSSLTGAVILILSNVFFIPAIYLAVKRELYAEGLVYLATMSFSSLYHACDQNDGRFCIAKYEMLQYSDFFSSILAFWITLVAMAELPSNFVPLCHMIGVFIITVGVQTNKTCLVSILVPLSMSIVIPIFMHIYRNIRAGKCKGPNRRTLVGLLFAIAGLLLYSFVETENNYRYIHSMWHIVMATSLVFLLPPKRIIPSRNVTLNDANESWSYKESQGIPMFAMAEQENQTLGPS